MTARAAANTMESGVESDVRGAPNPYAQMMQHRGLTCDKCGRVFGDYETVKMFRGERICARACHRAITPEFPHGAMWGVGKRADVVTLARPTPEQIEWLRGLLQSVVPAGDARLGAVVGENPGDTANLGSGASAFVSPACGTLTMWHHSDGMVLSRAQTLHLRDKLNAAFPVGE